MRTGGGRGGGGKIEGRIERETEGGKKQAEGRTDRHNNNRHIDIAPKRQTEEDRRQTEEGRRTDRHTEYTKETDRGR